MAELTNILIVIVSNVVHVLSSITIAGISLLSWIIFFQLAGMILVIVFRVRTGGLFSKKDGDGEE